MSKEDTLSRVERNYLRVDAALEETLVLGQILGTIQAGKDPKEIIAARYDALAKKIELAKRNIKLGIREDYKERIEK